MDNDNVILDKLRVSVGLDMNRSADFDVLAQAICDKNGERLGVNTLKRLFGYRILKVAPRRSTLDIIAQYLGYADYETLLKDVGEEADISTFSPIECLDVRSLAKGTRVRVAYEPNRHYRLTYLGDFRFLVEDVQGSRNIRPGDELTITQLAVGHRFVAANVRRCGEELGPYEAAKFRGVQMVEVEENPSE